MGFGQETPHDAIHDDGQQNSLLNAYSTHNYVIEYTTDTSGTRDCKSRLTDASLILEEKEVPDAYIVSTKMAEGGSSPGSPNESNVEGDSEVSSDSDKESIKRVIIEKLENLKPLLSSCVDIYDIFYDTPLHCLRESTQEKICFLLDPISDVQTDEDQLLKDYRGLAEWVNQEPAFIRYLTKCMIPRKTSEVIGKWITTEDEDPKPTIGNFRKCMVEENGIDRPDVITDLAPFICKDAFNHEMTKYEAITTKPVVRDTSWQLTRHDVVTGQRTYYTCCLVYADEDEGMAQIISQLYKKVRPGAMFFLPQFDLKRGKYIYETTARVIEERCDGKVIFIISEYFFASTVCQFAVNFSRSLDAASDQGNLIPFHLTTKYEHVPRVLRGIAGVKWFRKASRGTTWSMLTETLLAPKPNETQQLKELKQRLSEIIEEDEEYYLSDPPYDPDTPLPGEPISVYDPPFESENSDDPSANEFKPTEEDFLMSSVLDSYKPSILTRMRHFVHKKIMRNIFKNRSSDMFWDESHRKKSDMFLEVDPRNEVIYSRTCSTSSPPLSSIEVQDISTTSSDRAKVECSRGDNANIDRKQANYSKADTNSTDDKMQEHRSDDNHKLVTNALIEVAPVKENSNTKTALLQSANEDNEKENGPSWQSVEHHNMAFRDSSEAEKQDTNLLIEEEKLTENENDINT